MKSDEEACAILVGWSTCLPANPKDSAQALRIRKCEKQLKEKGNQINKKLMKLFLSTWPKVIRGYGL